MPAPAQTDSPLIRILREFWHRKSDGVGLAGRFPQAGRVLREIHDLLPERLRDLPDRDAAHLWGAAPMVIRKLFDRLGTPLQDQMKEMAREALLDAAMMGNADAAQVYGAMAAAEGKGPLDLAGGKAGDAVTDRIVEIAGAAMAIVAYEALKSGEDKLHQAELNWHRENGVPIEPGSPLGRWVGLEGPAHDLGATAALLDEFRNRNPFREAIDALAADKAAPRPPSRDPFEELLQNGGKRRRTTASFEELLDADREFRDGPAPM
ncbi:hypothetical protein [Defluviimonas salinarum]|uniref:Uncharacterized protein n=1 Tax=Defluviimonas salinarum TaxID=2992147 RepID=A0ABT3J754_9RHOB|nr:hypothetical protein [Defluviimonas salinarum]MCW3783530.1 hypothetical protein [Defluviimonas salinarum]